MKILVDADACPKPIKEIIFRAAKRLKIQVILFANHPLTIPLSPFIQFMQVPKGFDEADQKIVEKVTGMDLVVTADIPLAAATIERGGFALNPRGQFYNKDNIRQILSMRNFMETLRSSGEISGGPAPLHPSDLQMFANRLDGFLAKNVKNSKDSN